MPVNVGDVFPGGTPPGEVVGVRVNIVVQDDSGNEQDLSVTANVEAGWDFYMMMNAIQAWVNAGNLGQRSGKTYKVHVVAAQIWSVIEGGFGTPSVTFTG